MFYNTQRIHQSLNYVTPDEVYRTATGGGARIVDKFGTTEKMLPDTKKEAENRRSAVPLHVKGCPLKLGALLS